MKTCEPIPLDYGPPAPWLNQRRVRNCLTAMAVAIAIYCSYSSAVGRWNVLTKQRRCATFQYSVDTVVYFDAAKNATLPATSAPSNTGECAAVDSHIRSYFREVGGDFIAFSKGVFSHRLTSPAGDDRVILVSFIVFDQGCMGPTPNVTYCMLFDVMTVSSTGERPVSTHRTFSLQYEPRAAQRGLRVLSPRLDADDPSHLSFQYDTLARSGTVDVHLDDRGDLIFTTRGRPKLLDWSVGN